MTNFYQINAQSGDHIIYQLIETITIIDHHDNNQSINRLNHNRFTALHFTVGGISVLTHVHQLQAGVLHLIKCT